MQYMSQATSYFWWVVYLCYMSPLWRDGCDMLASRQYMGGLAPSPRTCRKVYVMICHLNAQQTRQGKKIHT